MQPPSLEAPAGPYDAGRAIDQLVDGLEHDAAARARHVDERGDVAVAVSACGAGLGPADLLEQEGGVVGAKHVRAGAGAGRLARQALEEGVAAEVEVQAGALSADGERDARIGVLEVDARPRPGLVREAVADGVLDAEGGVVGVPQLSVRSLGGDGDARAAAQDILPWHVVGAVVEGVGVPAVEASEHDEDAAGETGPQAGAVGVGDGSREGDAPLEAPGLAQADAPELSVER